jgi:hypothetical protein
VRCGSYGYGCYNCTPRKILVCGGRDYSNYETLRKLLDEQVSSIDTIIQGGARGADRLAKRYAEERGLTCLEVPAEWEVYKRQAGIFRNLAMLKLDPDLVIAFPGGSGTQHMIEIAAKKGVKIVRSLD